MELKLITAPTVEPVTLTTMKAYLRIDGTDSDTLLTSLLAAGRAYAEAFQNRAYLTQTWEASFDDFPESPFELPRPPLASVTSIKYTNSAGVEATVTSSDYQVDTDSTPGRVALKDGVSWPNVTLQPLAGVKVRFVCGNTTASPVSDLVKNAIMAYVAYFYDNPTGTEVPPWIKALLNLERLVPV